MILNGKAEVDFIKWASYNYGEDSGDLAMMREVYRNALIIEFFDSVGVYIDVEFFRKNIKDEPQFVSSTTDEWNGLQPLRVQFNSRQQATKQAIIKANNIYNERNII